MKLSATGGEDLVPHRQPGPVRRGRPAAGGRPVAGDRQPARRRRTAIPSGMVWKPVLTDAAAIRRLCLDANADDDCARRHRLDAHVLPGQDVDRRPGRAAQAAAAPAHPGQRRAAVGRDRHGLHEPQPGRARRPGVRLHPDPAGRRPQDRRRARQRPARWPTRIGAWARAAAAATARGPPDAAGPVRRQHARRRRDRGRQGRGRAALRRLGQHLRRQRPGRGGRRGRRRRTSTSSSRSTRTRTTSCPRCAPAASDTSRCATAPASSWACAASSTTAASPRSPRTSRTSAGCASCPASPCSG